MIQTRQNLGLAFEPREPLLISGELLREDDG